MNDTTPAASPAAPMPTPGAEDLDAAPAAPTTTEAVLTPSPSDVAVGALKAQLEAANALIGGQAAKLGDQAASLKAATTAADEAAASAASAELLVAKQAQKIEKLEAEVAALTAQLEDSKAAHSTLQAETVGGQARVEELEAHIKKLESRTTEDFGVEIAARVADGAAKFADLLLRYHGAVNDLVPRGIRQSIEQRVPPADVRALLGL